MGRLEDCLKLKNNLMRGLFRPSDKYCRNNCNRADCKWIGPRHKKKK